MELGQRIRQARLDAGLSQRQVCGDTITRNMLSLIESGKARPSMDTLLFLSRQLGKPLGYFLEESAVTSPNQQRVAQALESYKNRDMAEVLSLLKEYQSPDPLFDDLAYYLEAVASAELADRVAEEKPVYARQLLAQAEEAAQKTALETEGNRRTRLLTAYRAGVPAQEILTRLPTVTGELLLRADAAVQGGDPEQAEAILEAVTRRDARWYLQRGKLYAAAGDYRQAANCLTRAEQTYPGECIPLLERCYRELEDYKLAYEYACKQR